MSSAIKYVLVTLVVLLLGVVAWIWYVGSQNKPIL